MAVSPGAHAPQPEPLSWPETVRTQPARTQPARTQPAPQPAHCPGAVLVAFGVWLVVAGLFALGGLLLCLAAVLPTVPDPAQGGAPEGGSLLLVGSGLLLAAAGLARAALALRRGRPWARVTLSLLAVVLAVGGLLRVVLRDPAGLVLVATPLTVVLVYLPSADPHFARRERRGELPRGRWRERWRER